MTDECFANFECCIFDAGWVNKYCLFVLEVVQAFEQASGQKLNYSIGPRRPGDVPAIYANATKAAEALGFRTETSLATSLASSWKWQQTLGKN